MPTAVLSPIMAASRRAMMHDSTSMMKLLPQTVCEAIDFIKVESFLV